MLNVQDLERQPPERKDRQADIVLTRGPDGCQANVPRQIVYHSPDGFEFGYGGSGPADLALNILYCFLDGTRALRLHQAFKWDFIARMPAEGGTIRAAVIREWIDRRLS